MGNCMSCREVPPNEQPELRVVDGNRKISDIQTPSSSIVGMHRSEGCSGPGQENKTSPNNTYTTNNSCRNSSGFSSGLSPEPTITLSQKIEKKNFYSRIPPLGRSGSTSDRKSSLTASASIRDNNNQYSESKISTLYFNYKDLVEDAILPEGIERLCRDLELKPDDYKVLILAWKFDAKQMCRFTKLEFTNGMKELRTDTLKGVQARLHDLVTELLHDPLKFKDLYRFTFKFGLDLEIGQRILPVDMAISLWRVVFSQNEPRVLPRWISFLEKHPTLIRGIQRDTWNMFLNFSETAGNDLSSYDEAEAWPSLFDDFVEYENDSLNQNVRSSVGGESNTSTATSTTKGDHEQVETGGKASKTDQNDNSPKDKSHKRVAGKASIEEQESYQH